MPAWFNLLLLGQRVYLWKTLLKSYEVFKCIRWTCVLLPVLHSMYNVIHETIKYIDVTITSECPVAV